jgi:dihydroorotase
MKILITGGRIIDPSQKMDVNADLYISDGKIVSIKTFPDNFSPDHTINAQNLIVSPGFIDLSATVFNPRFSSESIEKELACAMRSGITTLAWMPVNTYTNPAALVSLVTQAKNQSPINIVPIAPLTVNLEGKQLNELSKLKENMSCAIVTNGNYPIIDTALKRRCYQYANMLGFKVFIFPQDPWLTKGFLHEGEVSSRLGLLGIPSCAETIGIYQELELIADTGIAAHFCRLSSTRAVQILQDAKSKFPNITADVAAYQLYLNEIDVSTFNSCFNVLPPLRSESDRCGLLAGIENKIISAVCSNHIPQPSITKNAPFSETQPGISLVLDLSKSDQSLINTLSLITDQPATILGSPAGKLIPGSPADICIFDANHSYTFTKENSCSLGKNTPFFNWDLHGRVEYTLIKGKVVYQRQ